MYNYTWLDKPYNSLNAYFKYVYGQKCYKIAVDAGLTCPKKLREEHIMQGQSFMSIEKK